MPSLRMPTISLTQRVAGQAGARGLRGGLAAIVFALVFVGLTPLAGAAPSDTPNDTWVANGNVLAIAPTKDTTYIAGSFSEVGPRTGPGVGINGSGTSTDLPEVSGGGGTNPSDFCTVRAVISDGAGGYYIGGNFTHVGGVPRRNLAHILATGEVDPTFAPNVNDTVESLALSASTLYAGGRFTEVGGEPHSHIAAIETADGDPLPWTVGANERVLALAVSGSTVFAGGEFTELGGEPRVSLGAVAAATGEAESWDPEVEQGAVFALALNGTTLYVGGALKKVGGVSRPNLAAFDTEGEVLLPWNPEAGHTVEALAVSGSTVYVGGQFGQSNGGGVGGEAREHLAAVEATGTGAVTSWDPNVSGNVKALAVVGSTVYAAGEFSKVGGVEHRFLAAIDAASGAATAWNPRPNDHALALVASPTVVYAGGRFASIGGVERDNLAQIDNASGAATAWNPQLDGFAKALAVSGTTLYVGGSFNAIDGQPRSSVAAFDRSSGALKSWSAALEVDEFPGTPSVDALAASGPTLYVGGEFDQVDGQPRQNLAAVSTVAGQPTAWQADADESVGSIALTESTAYVAGDFEEVDGHERESLAAVDRLSGEVTPWNPNPDSSVRALAVSGSTVYAGGFFSEIGGDPERESLAALDATSGEVTGWNPEPDSSVTALAVSGSSVYAGGSFTAIGGNPRRYLAEIDATSGESTEWDPSPISTPQSLAALGPAVYVGGEIRTFELAAQRNYAAFGQPGQEPEEVPSPEEETTQPGDGEASTAPPAIALSSLPTPAAPGTKLRRSRIDGRRGVARFTFGAGGTATGFECSLIRMSPKGRKQPFRPCRSPKVYSNLTSGRYLFRVRAKGPGGTDRTPAKREFSIARRTH
jgi:hypothetical protein